MFVSAAGCEFVSIDRALPEEAVIIIGVVSTDCMLCVSGA